MEIDCEEVEIKIEYNESFETDPLAAKSDKITSQSDGLQNYKDEIKSKGMPLTKEEVMILIGLVEANTIITSKATNASSNKLKEEAWSAITNQFNASVSSCPRRSNQLKLKWENLKKAARKRAKIRLNSFQTGGGKHGYIPPDDALDHIGFILGVTCHGYQVPFGGHADEATLDVDAKDFDNLDYRECTTTQDTTPAGSGFITGEVRCSTSIHIHTIPAKRKKIFFSSTSSIANQKNNMVAIEDAKARIARNTAIAEYYKEKKKKKSLEIENVKLQNEKLKLELKKFEDLSY